MTLQIPIRISDSGKMLELNLGEIQNLLITGKTGTGKSTLLKSIVKSIDKQSCKIILIDTKGFDFKGFSSKNLICPVISDEKSAINYLGELTGVDNDTVIIIDELSDLIATSDKSQILLQEISKSPHIHIIMATRMPQILSDDFKQTFNNHISFSDIGHAEYNKNNIKTKS